MKLLLTVLFTTIVYNASSQNADSLVDFNSLTTVLIEARKGKKALWNATGFFLQVKKRIYLITNNHVVGAEYHVEDFKRQHKNDSTVDTIPDIIMFRRFDKRVGSFEWNSMALEDSKGNLLYTKIYEDETNKKILLDVVGIPFRGLNKMVGKVIVNGYDSTSLGEIPLYNSEQLFVIGYPEYSDNFYPIWKSGTIASEPNFMSIGNSTFYIDATTRRGMSGSPVIFRDSKIYDIKGGGFRITSNMITRLIGVYSAQNYKSELGFVTRIETIYRNLYKDAY